MFLIFLFISSRSTGLSLLHPHMCGPPKGGENFKDMHYFIWATTEWANEVNQFFDHLLCCLDPVWEEVMELSSLHLLFTTRQLIVTSCSSPTLYWTHFSTCVEFYGILVAHVARYNQ